MNDPFNCFCTMQSAMKVTKYKGFYVGYGRAVERCLGSTGEIMKPGYALKGVWRPCFCAFDAVFWTGCPQTYDTPTEAVAMAMKYVDVLVDIKVLERLVGRELTRRDLREMGVAEPAKELPK